MRITTIISGIFEIMTLQTSRTEEAEKFKSFFDPNKTYTVEFKKDAGFQYPIIRIKKEVL